MSSGLVRGYTRHLTPVSPGAARTNPLDRGLVAEWRFDENTGLFLPDYSGYGNHSTSFSGSPAWVVTRHGPALHFDGNTCCINVADAPSLDLISTGTLEVFCEVTTLTQDSHAGLISKTAGWTAGDMTYALHWRNTDNVLRAYIGDGAAVDHISMAEPTTLGFYHWIFTWDGSFLHLYANGVEGPAPVAQNRNCQVTGHSVRVGGDGFLGSTAADDFTGRILEARIYNRALSAAEVRARYPICLKHGQPLTHVWMMPWGMAPVAPPVGGHMTLWGRYWGP